MRPLTPSLKALRSAAKPTYKQLAPPQLHSKQDHSANPLQTAHLTAIELETLGGKTFKQRSNFFRGRFDILENPHLLPVRRDSGYRKSFISSD